MTLSAARLLRLPRACAAWIALGLAVAGCGSSTAARPDAGDAADAGASQDAGPSTSVAVSIERDGGVPMHIGAGFAGLSYEKDHLNTGFFTPDNADLIGLFKRLGPSVLRIGGNSVDKTTWSATGSGNTVGVISPPDVTALAGFLQATGWTVIYGVNLAADDSSAAAAEAAFVSTAIGSSLYGFEIGNECDVYQDNGIRPSGWPYADFLSQWQTFYAAMHAAAPSAQFTGPASAAHVTNWTVPFAADAAPDIVLLTQHYYRGNGMSASSTLAELLLPDPTLSTSLDALNSAALANHISDGYRLAEANSFYNGGAPGISDGYGTALWVIDFLFTNAQHGSAGVNFHGGGDGTGYTPIADSNSVVVEARPDYYGMLFFSLAGQGDLLTTSFATTLNFTAYALSLSNGSTSVVLVNKDPTTRVHASVDLHQAASSGATTLLTGPTLSATTGYTIGGAAVNPDGSWSPIASQPISVQGQSFAVDVPPASAILIHAE